MVVRTTTTSRSGAWRHAQTAIGRRNRVYSKIDIDSSRSKMESRYNFNAISIPRLGETMGENAREKQPQALPRCTVPLGNNLLFPPPPPLHHHHHHHHRRFFYLRSFHFSTYQSFLSFLPPRYLNNLLTNSSPPFSIRVIRHSSPRWTR